MCVLVWVWVWVCTVCVWGVLCVCVCVCVGGWVGGCEWVYSVWVDVGVLCV